VLGFVMSLFEAKSDEYCQIIKAPTFLNSRANLSRRLGWQHLDIVSRNVDVLFVRHMAQGRFELLSVCQQLIADSTTSLLLFGGREFCAMLFEQLFVLVAQPMSLSLIEIGFKMNGDSQPPQ
jgi:hypothetical protein